MSKQTLCENILKHDTYPKQINVEAPNCCGTVCILLGEGYTKQMVYELPNITVNVYTVVNGEYVLYTSRAISLQVPENIKSIEAILMDIPTSCTMFVQPEFDNYAVDSHNEDVFINGGEEWTETQTFPLTLIWDNSNISASGSGGGGGGTGVKEIYSATTASWNSQTTLISKEDTMYVYTDYLEIDGQYVPGIKMGDGVTVVKDLPFIAGSVSAATITDAEIDGTTILDGTVAKIATTGSYDGDSTSQDYNPLATKDYVDDAIDALPEPMVFRGTLGAQADSPTITALPVDGSANVGDTYKVITAGTYDSQAAKVGDLFICLTKTSNANTWSYVPSADEPSGTVTNVTAGVGLTTASGSAITDTGTIKAKLTSETAITGDGVTSVGVDSSGNLAVDIRVVDGTYNASTNKVATQSTVTNAINALDGGTIGEPGAGKTVTALSQTDGNISATFSDIAITVSQVTDVTADTTINSVSSSAASSTAATNELSYYTYNATTETLTLNKLIGTPTANVVAKPST